MPLPRAQRDATTAPPGPRPIHGTARLGKRTKHLVKRVKRGEVAVIDHLDLDRVSAEDLIACGVAAVLNQAPSASGRYPNMGPLLLARAGVHLVDGITPDLWEVLGDGDRVEIRGGDVVKGGEVVASGVVQDLRRAEEEYARRREEVGEALGAFVRNTAEYMVQEVDLLSGDLPLPELRTSFRDRPCLVVVRGVDHKRDLRVLRSYIRDVKPVLVGVDGGADAIVEEGFLPDMIVGDMDSATEATLRCGAELVVHAYPDGRAPGREHLEELGLPHEIVPAPGTSQDIAMLIAAERGAELIVSVGSHMNLVEFLDKNRPGMASTFITRMRIGEILVDAKGVGRLYRPRPGSAPIAFVALAGLLTLLSAIVLTPGLADVADLLWLKLRVVLGID